MDHSLDKNRLKPPSSSSLTESAQAAPEATMLSAPESDQSSAGDSPVVTSGRKLDTSDPFSFLMDSVAADILSGSESSTEESFVSSAPPSIHDSPVVDWLTSSDKKDVDPDFWGQPDFAGLPFDANAHVDMMNYDPTSLGMPLTLEYLLSNPLFTDSANIPPNNGAAYPFSFQANNIPSLTVSPADGSDTLTSGSSSSAASVSSPSPIPRPAQLHSTPTPLNETPDSQSVEELARRALQAVGVSIVLPDGASQQHPGKLPIPRLHHTTAIKRENPAESSTPPPPPSSSSSASSSPAPTSGPAPRTKTSHTTIERRYRTNINSRIQGLRAAVPALRVLEHKPGNRVGNLPLKPGTRRAGIDVAPGAVDESVEDVIDERGFIDGVKVARKGSKANVLAKATEYIRVLKRREYRLKREQDGLKALVVSLLGSDVLVREWETMWREKFGGPETDEVEGEDGEADDEIDDEDEDEDDMVGKKRKRPKVETKPKKLANEAPLTTPIAPTPSSSQSPTSLVAQPEKRKRGRPRKLPIAPMPEPSTLMQNKFSAKQTQQLVSPMHQAPITSIHSLMDIDHAIAQTTPSQPQSQPAQYLLAAFAFFSFFNSPLSYSSSWTKSHHGQAHEHTHTGVVLGDTQIKYAPQSVAAFNWRDVVQVIHLAVSLLLLVSIIVPWLPRVTRSRIIRLVPNCVRPILGSTFVSVGTRSRSSSDASNASEDGKDGLSVRAALLGALQPVKKMTPAQEAQALRDALGLRNGMLGLLASVARQLRACVSGSGRSRSSLERRMLEQRAVVRLAELVALDAHASATTRIQTFLYAHRFLAVFSASATDISTLALVIQPVSHTKAESLWTLAGERACSDRSSGNSSPGLGALYTTPHVARAYETYVLQTMTVEDAAGVIAEGLDTTWEDVDADGSKQVGPLALLARHSIRAAVRKHAETAFLRELGEAPIYINPDVPSDKDEIQRLTAAALDLDRCTAALAGTCERVCALGLDAILSEEDAEEATVDKELYALLAAVSLCRSLNLFPGSSSSNVPHAGKVPLAPPPTAASLTAEATREMDAANLSIRRTQSLALRRTLASGAFERSDTLEEARDRVVDALLAVAEREREYGVGVHRSVGRVHLRAS